MKDRGRRRRLRERECFTIGFNETVIFENGKVSALGLPANRLTIPGIFSNGNNPRTIARSHSESVGKGRDPDKEGSGEGKGREERTDSQMVPNVSQSLK